MEGGWVVRLRGPKGCPAQLELTAGGMTTVAQLRAIAGNLLSCIFISGHNGKNGDHGNHMNRSSSTCRQQTDCHESWIPAQGARFRQSTGFVVASRASPKAGDAGLQLQDEQTLADVGVTDRDTIIVSAQSGSAHAGAWCARVASLPSVRQTHALMQSAIRATLERQKKLRQRLPTYASSAKSYGIAFRLHPSRRRWLLLASTPSPNCATAKRPLRGPALMINCAPAQRTSRANAHAILFVAKPSVLRVSEGLRFPQSG